MIQLTNTLNCVPPHTEMRIIAFLALAKVFAFTDVLDTPFYHALTDAGGEKVAVITIFRVVWLLCDFATWLRIGAT